MLRTLAIVAVVMGLCGCGGGTVGVMELDGSLPDMAADVQVEEVLAEVTVEVTGEVWSETIWEIGPEVFVECETGCFMDPCEDGEDCQSGLCIDHFTGSACTQSCIEECPAGWQCKELSIYGTDSVFACASPFTHLCRPCHSDGDCKSPSGTEDICVDYGAMGSFCGASCVDLGCPDGYSCEEVTTSGGATATQCVPDSGECFCSPQATTLAASTSCYAESEFGLCEGIRSCSETGLSDCGAPPPAPEECNGLDDDCNGEIDEGTCDDGDECTMDSCLPEVGCVNEPQTGTGCDDEDVCSLADHCEAGICTGTPTDCNDQNPCTYDDCDSAWGCTYTDNTQTCDDENPCTVGDTCTAGVCEGVEVECDCMQSSDCGALEDGDLCNGTLVCDVGVLPHKCAVDPNTVVTCDEPTGPDAACLMTECDPLSAECSWVAANDGGPCSDGDVCTASDSCDQGTCLGGPSANCNDGNPCTDDGCDPVAGCIHDTNQAPCEDGDVCTVEDQCADSACVSGPPLDCDDGNPCSDDSCDSAVGCQHLNNVAQCDDSNNCTTGDICSGGQCLGSGTLDCDDDNPCSDDSCDALVGCLHANNALPCDDDDSCTSGEVCAGGTCQGGATLNCNDGNPCTDDSCHPQAGCQHEDNEATCSDDDVCTTGDICADGACAGAGELACDDANVCTADTCDALQGCLHAPEDGECDDGNACTPDDSCSDGFCAGSGLLDCNDGDPCTNEWCDPSSGCVEQFNSAPCNDEDLCTVGDTCELGECKGSGSLDCDDGNVCTVDSCDPQTGCTHVPGDGECDDQNPCTADDQCTGGICKGLGLTDCDDGNICTDDSCNPQTGCVYSYNTQLCDDGNACTVGDQCADGICGAGAPLDCDDSNDCTDDSCDVALGCQYANNDAACDDGNPCTTNDACAGGNCLATDLTDCDDGNICTNDSCNPLTGCIHEVNTSTCDDGDACTVTDICADSACSGSGDLDCDDGDSCTTDTCDADTGCVHTPVSPCCGNDVTEDPEECDDGNLDNGDGCSSTCTIELQSSCKILLILQPGLPSGTYDIDANDDDVAETVYCDMTTDGGGYTMVRYDDASLAGNQTTYLNWCAARGMEIIVPRTKAHALAILAWNNGTPPNLVNVYPKYNGASGLSNWTGKCGGVDCSFWMSDSNSCGCTNFEPNGDNNTAYTIYRRTTGCDFGNWNDANNRVDIHGSVICSTNDK